MNIEEIEKICESENHPLVFAADLSFFISDGLNDGRVNTYEALLFADVEAELLRKGYTQPAFDRNFSVSDLLRLVMLYMTANVYGLYDMARKYKFWIGEGMSITSENRKHYSFEIAELILAGNEKAVNETLLRIRQGKLPFSEGPYHTEFFPFAYIEPERILQDGQKIEQHLCADRIGDLIQLIDTKFCC